MTSKFDIRLIYFMGADGVGKTTHAKLLTDNLKKKGINAQYSWLRFFHFTSLIILIYCRIIGLTKYEIIEDQKMGRHEFYKSSIVSYIYPRSLLFDHYLLIFIKIYLPGLFGRIKVCDRFVYDTIVDLMIDLRDDKFYKSIIGKKFTKLLTKNNKIMLIDLEPSIIRDRRNDLIADNTLEKRRKYYLEIAKHFNIKKINNKFPINEVQLEIMNELGLD